MSRYAFSLNEISAINTLYSLCTRRHSSYPYLFAELESLPAGPEGSEQQNGIRASAAKRGDINSAPQAHCEHLEMRFKGGHADGIMYFSESRCVAQDNR